MTKKELWNVFMKTGKVSDYLKYKNAKDIRNENDELNMELADEFYLNNPHAEDFYYDDKDGWYNNP